MVVSRNNCCSHSGLQVDVSSHAPEAGFSRAPPAKRVAATAPSGRVVTQKPGKQGNPNPISEYSFPGPLVLPGDALAIDPEEPPQSLRSFILEKARNPLTNRRKTIYVGQSPAIAPELSQMKVWSTPSCTVSSASKTNKQTNPQPPKHDGIMEYLQAFYHPLPVKPLPGPISFVPWSDSHTSASRSGRRDKSSAPPAPAFVGLQLGNGITRIRTRPCPDGAFSYQIDLNDVSDALIEALPQDAHSAILTVDQDMYDDDEDTFCCGHAYGGSRVAVVSSARYHPALDYEYYDDEDGDGDDAVRVEIIDRQHMWPTSHCGEYVERMCGIKEGPKRKKAKVIADGSVVSASREVEATPLGAAIKAAQAAPDPERDLEGLWLSRVARTVSHELGHCFAIAHCTYYACVLQGTAGIAEDMRQPPYLCPVCLSKITKAITDVERNLSESEWLVERYKALAKFCQSRMQVAMFAGFHAWLGKRIEELNDGKQVDLHI